MKVLKFGGTSVGSAQRTTLPSAGTDKNSSNVRKV